MVDSSDEFFYNNIIYSLDDEDFVVATMVVNEHISRMRLMFGHAVDELAEVLGDAVALGLGGTRPRRDWHSTIFVRMLDHGNNAQNQSIFGYFHDNCKVEQSPVGFGMNINIRTQKMSLDKNRSSCLKRICPL